MHRFVGGPHHFDALRTQTNDLAGTDVAVYGITEIGKGCRLRCGGKSPVFASDDDRRAPPLVSGGDNAVFGEQEHRTGAFDVTEDVFDAFDKRVALDEQQGDEFGLIGLARREFGKVHLVFKQLLFKLVDVDDFGHCDDGKAAEV